MSRSTDIITSNQAARKGRGALSNRGSRYQPTYADWNDGLESPSPVTECRRVEATTIISRNRSPDIPFTQSINPYQGCEHGCVYCYARPTHAYLDLSPGLDFETRLTYKTNAAELLEKAFRRPGYRCENITLGANTDPYQPVEREHLITRQLLEVLQAYHHPVSIITKSTLVTRDLDILGDMATRNLCTVSVSITTLDDELKRRMEPRACSGTARLKAVEMLATAGIPVSVLVAPVIPALNDSELESILREARSAGATGAAYILLRLPLEIRELFQEWLQEHYPMRAGHVSSLIRQSRNGADYDRRFGHRMRGTGTFADLLEKRFELCCRKLGLEISESSNPRDDLFAPPVQKGSQFDLFS